VAAVTRLRESAEVHGWAAYRRLTDINVSYSGQWRPLINLIQPELVDAGFRGPSQEQLMPAERVVAQAYTGTLNRKQVWWLRGNAAPDQLGDGAVWFNGVQSNDRATQDTAALVAEGYGLFLLGPLWLNDRELSMQLNGTERVDDRLWDVVNVWLTPGLGRVTMDRVAVCIDRADGVMRRVRFTLEVSRARGAVAEVDTFEHDRRFGVLWPMRSYERVVHPIPIPAHDWRITGLDVNRGYAPRQIAAPDFTNLAAAPAAKL
jgi:hypothetical protein